MYKYPPEPIISSGLETNISLHLDLPVGYIDFKWRWAAWTFQVFYYCVLSLIKITEAAFSNCKL